MPELAPGLVGEASKIVTDDLTAAAIGSGLVPAFSTPSLVSLMETAAYTAVGPHLSAGQTSVGVDVSIKHLAASPVGMRVRARAELMRVEGRRLFFRVEAWDEVDKIGEGTHDRMVVDRARFDDRLQEKASQKRTLEGTG
ncbi:MAG: thioesterase family protein [Rudaea sp.]